MFCKYCGSTIDDDSMFCLSCGKNVREYDKAAAAEYAKQAAPMSQQEMDLAFSRGEAVPAQAQSSYIPPEPRAYQNASYSRPAPVMRPTADIYEHRTLKELQMEFNRIEKQAVSKRRVIRGFAIASLVFLIILAIIVIGSAIRTNTREAIWGASWNSVGEDARNGFACAVGFACVIGSILSIWALKSFTKASCFTLAGFYIISLAVMCIPSGGYAIMYYWWLLIPGAIFIILGFTAAGIDELDSKSYELSKAISKKERDGDPKYKLHTGDPISDEYNDILRSEGLAAPVGKLAGYSMRSLDNNDEV